MPRYRLYLTRSVDYIAEVEADSPEDAHEKLYEMSYAEMTIIDGSSDSTVYETEEIND